MSLDRNRAEFTEKGCTLIRAAVNPKTAVHWARRAMQATDASRVDKTLTAKPEHLEEGGGYHVRILDALQSQQAIPELFGWYEAGTTLLAHITSRTVITSPYLSSSVTVKVYDRPGDGQSWHRDTNPLTAMLILTETRGSHGTQVELRDGSILSLENEPGDLWVMLGRELRHSVPPLPPEHVRVTVPLNYYHPDDVWRPEGIDGMIYGQNA